MKYFIYQNESETCQYAYLISVGRDYFYFAIVFSGSFAIVLFTIAILFNLLKRGRLNILSPLMTFCKKKLNNNMEDYEEIKAWHKVKISDRSF